MTIETLEPDLTLTTDENRNDIGKQFGIYVINSSLTAVSPGVVRSGFFMGKAHLSVPEVIMIDSVPNNTQVVDDFDNVYSLAGAPVGCYPVINSLLSDNKFMASLDVESLKCTAVTRHYTRPARWIESFS